MKTIPPADVLPDSLRVSHFKHCSLPLFGVNDYRSGLTVVSIEGEKQDQSKIDISEVPVLCIFLDDWTDADFVVSYEVGPMYSTAAYSLLHRVHNNYEFLYYERVCSISYTLNPDTTF